MIKPPRRAPGPLRLAMKFFLVSEVAAALRLSVSQVYALIDSGKLRAHRFTTKKHGAVRVSQQQLDDYLRESESVGAAPAKEQAAPEARPSGFTMLDGERLREAWRLQGAAAGPPTPRSAPSS